MLGDRPFYSNIPVQELSRARRFYEDVLGAIPVRGGPTEVVYRTGDTRLTIHLSARSTAFSDLSMHTFGTFLVDDIEARVAGLRAAGVDFEEYDLPELQTVNGVAQVGDAHVAWFRDPDQNLLSITQEAP